MRPHEGGVVCASHSHRLRDRATRAPADHPREAWQPGGRVQAGAGCDVARRTSRRAVQPESTVPTVNPRVAVAMRTAVGVRGDGDNAAPVCEHV